MSDGGAKRKVTFSSPQYRIPLIATVNFCFAGQDDELVVAASADYGLFVWSLPTDQQVAGDQVIDQPLVVLQGHKMSIFAVRYSRPSDTLASAGFENMIKLWTPIAQQH